MRDTKHYALRELTIREYLRTHTVRKLQLGAGGNLLEGWLNTDQCPFSRKVAYLDVTRRFPLPDESIDFVLSEHHIEHLTWAQGGSMLRECYRVLRRGGRIRVSTPDLEQILRLYGNPGTDGERYIRFMTERFLRDAPDISAIFVINLCMRIAGHQFVYDGPTLVRALETAGFTAVERFTPGLSRTAELRGVDSHERFLGNAEMNRYQTMVYEAAKS
ncbi:MAG TPA: methyltransferase domain-containing protein [Actinomycetota bacterium]|nr:methyltransferase domain-containing protein [Actinomycetota bacterium]